MPRRMPKLTVRRSARTAQSATLLQPADWASSGFYISNPNNYLTNNAASGGTSGFMVLVLPTPIGVREAHMPC
jgi:hypothetical protein